MNRWIDHLFHREGSVIRRSTGLFLFFIPGLLFNYGLIYLASRNLEAAAFGVLFTAFTIINVLVAPVFIANMFLSREFAELAVSDSSATVRSVAWATFLRVSGYSGLCAVVVALLMLWIGYWSQVTAVGIVFLIVAQAYLFYPAEVVRSYLQGTQKFFWVGMFGLAWLALRFAFGTTGLFLVSTAWAVLAGTVMATVVMVAVSIRLNFSREPVTDAASVGMGPGWRIWAYFAAAYGLVILIANVDVFMAYALLERSDAGVYAASSVLPKAMLILLLPIIQVGFTTLASTRARGDSGTPAFLKALALTVLCAVGAVGALFALSGYVCGGTIGIAHCEPDLMNSLAIAAAGVVVIRLIVLRELADRNDLQPLILLLPLTVFVVVALRSTTETGCLAEIYAIFVLGSLVAYSAVCAASAFLARGSRS